MIQIRKAKLNDTKTIQKLNHELFKLEKKCFDSTLITDWPLSKEGEKYFEDLIKNSYVIIALKDEIPVAYLAGSISDRCPYSLLQYGEINNMFVDSSSRGQGIGKTLVDYFKQYCAEKNIQNLKVVASAKNKNAQEFYRKQGFSEFDITLTI